MLIGIDTTALSFHLYTLPDVEFFTKDGHFEDGSATPTPKIELDPGTYAFQQGGFADFVFLVTDDGKIDYSTECDAFLGGRGTDTLILVGYTVTLDATALDHDLLPLVSFPEPLDDHVLSRSTTHELTLVPATAYGFICASAVVASFTFGLDITGQLSIDAEYQGFAAVDNATHTLTLGGYAITFDGTLLTHDLFPQLLGNDVQLTRDSVHTLRLIPELSNGMVVASGVLGNFSYAVNTDGTVSFPPEDAGFLEADGAKLILKGYPVVFDTSAADASLAEAPITRWYGLQVLIPANWGVQTSDGAFYVLVLDLNGDVSGDPDHPEAYKVGTVPRLGLIKT